MRLYSYGTKSHSRSIAPVATADGIETPMKDGGSVVSIEFHADPAWEVAG